MRGHRVAFNLSFDVQYTITMESGAFVKCDVKKSDFVFTTFICEFNKMMECINSLHEDKELVLSPSPDDKYIINESLP